ncbi:Spaetzle [Trinorchestia longiramus]|nr:Spaetzle [Trinorchestia longiramus]
MVVMLFCGLVLGAAALLGAVHGDASSTSHVSISLGKSSVAYNNDHLHGLQHDGTPAHKHDIPLEHDLVHVPERSDDRGRIEVPDPPFLESDREWNFGSSRHFSITPFIHSTLSPSHFEPHDHVSRRPYSISISSPAPFIYSAAEKFHYPSFSFPKFSVSTSRPSIGGAKAEKALTGADESHGKKNSSKLTKERTSKPEEKEEQRSNEDSEQESDEKDTGEEGESKDVEQEPHKDKSSITSVVNSKVFHPSQRIPSSINNQEQGILRIPNRPSPPPPNYSIYQSHLLSSHPSAPKQHRLEHKFKYNSEKSPACAKDHKDYCQEDDDYPGYEILNAAYEHSAELLKLYADVSQLNTELSVELSEKTEKHESYLCPANITYAQTFRAKNIGGRWRFIVNNIKLHYQTLTQTVRLEECLLDGEVCPMVPHCYESTCLQNSAYHRFLVYDPYDHHFPFLIESFKLPAACACYLAKYELEH